MLRYRILFAFVGLFACASIAFCSDAMLRSAAFKPLLRHLTQPILILPDSTTSRVLAAGGHPGEVEITLEWHNKNDLDLSCIDPQGNRIWYGEKRSPTGGQLDIDANANVINLTDSPVEHIVWPFGAAPHGSYQVYVTYFAQHDKRRSSPFHITVNNNGHYSQFGGTLSQVGTRLPVDSFTLDSSTGLGVAQLWAILITCLACAAWAALIFSPLLPAFAFVRRRISVAPVVGRLVRTTIYVHSSLLFAASGFVAQLVFLASGWMLTEGASIAHMPVSFEAVNVFVHVCGFAALGGAIGAVLRSKLPGLEYERLSWAILFAGAVAGFQFAILMFDPLQPERVLAAGMLGAAIGFMMCIVYDEAYAKKVLTTPISTVGEGLAPNRANPAGRLPGLKPGQSTSLQDD